jgi:tetratricopeptide (TPR) repeat protein
MNRDRWQKVEEVLSGAIELPEGRQEDYIKERCSDDPSLFSEVAELLEAHRKASTFIEHPAAQGFPKDWPDGLIGSQFGAYKLLERIGEGGMGAVYRAERSDGQFTQEVAVKVVRPGLGNQELLRRLRGERQILASLSHPNIARLLDGGITFDGQPYVVMEFIPGAPIVSYCDREKLDIGQRLQLFQEICSAVSYAHQRLVVHRDIKPANILVTKEGTPTLLDFGIAKIVDPTGLDSGQTLTGLNPLTPDYASPEQLRGETITTATDVYSLGVLLYELLTSQRPYQLKDKTPLEAAEFVCRTDPQRPSAVVSNQSTENTKSPRPAISSDLDAIVLKAMRKEPEQRYASVEKLSEDIGNFLAARPVAALQGNWRYVAGKFVRRHRTAVLLSGAMAILLVAGISAVLWEAHVARMQRARAEQRFNDVRKLANSLIFEVHDGVANLPGSTPVRKLIVQRAAEYLDSLSKDAAGDVGLQVELAGAYIRLAYVQGSDNSANLGDIPDAEQSYAKAQALLQAVLAKEPLRDDANGLLARSNRYLAYLYLGTHRPEKAAEAAQRVLIIDQGLASRHPGNDMYLEILALGWHCLADVEESAGNPESLNHRNKALQLYEQLLARDPSNPNKMRNVALAEKTLGSYLLMHGSIPQAPKHYRRAQELDQKILDANRENALAALDVSFDLESLADYYYETGDWDNSLRYGQQALEIRRRLAAADPNDVHMPQRIIYTRLKLGAALEKLGRLGAAREQYQMAIDAAEPLAQPSTKGAAWDFLGEALQQMGNLKDHLASKNPAPQARPLHQQACADYTKAYAILHGNANEKSAAEENEKSLKRCPGGIPGQK